MSSSSPTASATSASSIASISVDDIYAQAMGRESMDMFEAIDLVLFLP